MVINPEKHLLCPEPWHAPRPETALVLEYPTLQFIRIVGRAEGRKRATLEVRKYE